VGLGAVVSSPDTDLSVLPTVPPVEPAWANAVSPAADDAMSPDTNAIAIRRPAAPISSMFHIPVSFVLRVFAAAFVEKGSDGRAQNCSLSRSLNVRCGSKASPPPHETRGSFALKSCRGDGRPARQLWATSGYPQTPVLRRAIVRIVRYACPQWRVRWPSTFEGENLLSCSVAQ
jgi:hypothetical protein